MTYNQVDAGRADDVRDGDVIGIEAGGQDIALCRVGDEFYAIDNTCTHGQARLCDGFLDGYEIECPLHQGKFDVRTGRALCAPVTEDIRSYEVSVVAGRVLIELKKR